MSIKLLLANLQVALCKLGFFPTLLPFWMKAHKRRQALILCFVQGHDGSFPQLSSLETAFLQTACSL